MPAPQAADKVLVFVTVGTDHHPFDRLVHWIDEWLAAGGAERARCLVQVGRSTPSRLAESVEYLGYDDMRRVAEEATAVVTHGGPGSIALATSVGKRPVVVPRQKELGEHVDDHQLVFTRRIAADAKIELAETEDAFRAALERALKAPAGVDAAGPASFAAVARFEHAVDDLLSSDREKR